MPLFTLLFIVVTLVIACLAYVAIAGWGVTQNARRKPENPRDRRRNEEAALNTEQRKLYKRAQALLAERNIKDAARILESIGMVRKSVSILEKNGFHDIAAEILLRINRPHRAAVIYARAGKWEKSMHCFKMAKMPIEVAKCLHEIGRFNESAKLFEKSRDYTNAAYTYKKCFQLRDAARCLYFSGKKSDSYKYLKGYLKENLHLHDFNLTKNELKLIEEHVFAGEHDAEVIHALVQENYLGDTIHKLIKLNRVEDAAKLYKHADSKAIASLIGQVSLGDSSSEKILELFKINNDKISLAMSHEKLGNYDKAGEIYEDANDLIQALSCFSQCSDATSVQRVSQKISETKGKKEEEPSSQVVPFNTDNDSKTNTQARKQILDECMLFERLNNEQKRNFWLKGQTLKFKEGQEVLGQNEIPKGIYIVLSGFIEAHSEGDRAIMGEGEVFGFQNILLNQDTHRDYKCNSNCLIHFLSSSELRSVMDRDGKLTRILFQNALKMAYKQQQVDADDENAPLETKTSLKAI